MINPNDGDRLSTYTLDRYATGELSADEAARVEAQLDDRARAHLRGLEEARSAVAPFDAAALRDRATAIDASSPALGDPPRLESPGPMPTPANNSRAWTVWAPLVALAALLLAAVLPGLLPGSTPDGVRFRSGDVIEAYHLQDGVLRPYDGTAVGEGDTLGFKVSAGEHRGVVVLSVDGTGQVSVFWPAQGADPEPLDGEGLVPLDGSVQLDGSPGPEVFVAVFDAPVADAKAQVERAFQSGGHVGLLEWAQLSSDADAVQVQRR